MLSMLCQAQTRFNIRAKKLNTITIDTNTEKVFIYEVPSAVLFFRQNDVLDIINNIGTLKDMDGREFTEFKQALKSNVNKIRIRDINYSYDQHERDSILKFNIIDKNELQLDDRFYYLEDELLMAGKFMIYSKKQKAIVTKHLMAKRRKGIMGGSNLVFMLPNGEIFYSVIISLGD